MPANLDFQPGVHLPTAIAAAIIPETSATLRSPKVTAMVVNYKLCTK